jgi:parallel beta-helix repeat protein
MGDCEGTRGNRVSSRLLLVGAIALLLLCSTNPGFLICSVPSAEMSLYFRPASATESLPSLQRMPLGLPHVPIVITSDADFGSQGWPGSGTPADPYRIQNYSIEVGTAGQSCIDISNTLVHFIVSQCGLTGATLVTNTSGITLKNVCNGNLDNNAFLFGTYGVSIQNSSLTTVVNSIFSSQQTAAATLVWSNSCIVENNTLLNSINGISLDHSTLCQLARNNCTSSHYGLSLEESDSNRVFNNTCVGAASGIRVESSSENNTVANNTCVGCYLGIGFSWSNSNKALQNQCVNSTGGIGLEGTEFCIVANNTLTNLAGGGIQAVESDHLQVANNTLTNLAGGGIEASASDYCTVVDNTLTRTQEGIYLRWSRSSTIANNSVIRSTYGISLFESNASNVLNNILLGCGFSVSGDTIPGCHQASLNYNLVNEQPLVFWQDRVGGVVPKGAGQVILVNCVQVVVSDQILANCTIGIQLSFSNSSSLVNNTCTDNQDGISLRLSMFNVLSANVLARNHQGIFLYRSSNNTITKQVCSKNEIGIRLAWWSSSNTLMDNTCTESWQGITLEYQSSWNRILWNVLSANVYNAYDTAPKNSFDYNYWSDYWGFDLNQDGIGDIPYIVPPAIMGSFDAHPLMSPPGTPPTFGLREAFWLTVFLTSAVGLSMLVGVLALLYHRRRQSREAKGKRRGAR